MVTKVTALFYCKFLIEIQYQKWKDQYKKDYAINQGYTYIEIPYWTILDESYKKILDNNIN